MALLDVFTLLFETDADEAAKKVDDLGESLEDAGKSGESAARGLDQANAEAASGVDAFNGLAKSVGGLVAAYLSWQAISAAVLGQAVATDEVGKFADTMGLAIEEVDAWSEAAIRSGGSADGFRNSVESLNEKLGDFALTGGGEAAEVLARLGVSAMDASGRIRPVTSVMLDLADSFQSLSSRESFALGKRLGLDQGTILMLQQGRSAVEALVEQQRQLGGRTKEGYEASAKFNDTLADTQRIFVGWADAANQRILPILTDIMVGFQAVVDWASEHEDVVKGFFIAIAGVVTVLYLPSMVAAAAATLAATWPILAIIAAIGAFAAAVAILYEDVKAYIGGQESYVGSLAAKYEWFGKLLDGVIAGVKFLIREFTEFGIEMFSNLMTIVDTLGETFQRIFDAIGIDIGEFGATADTVTDAVIAAFELLGKGISKTLDFIASPIKTTTELIKELIAWIEKLNIADKVKGYVDEIASYIPFVGDDEDEANENELRRLERQASLALSTSNAVNMNPIVLQPGGGYVSRNYVQNNTFQTRIDARGMGPDEARSVVGDHLAEQLRGAKGGLDDGVAY